MRYHLWYHLCKRLVREFELWALEWYQVPAIAYTIAYAIAYAIAYTLSAIAYATRRCTAYETARTRTKALVLKLWYGAASTRITRRSTCIGRGGARP